MEQKQQQVREENAIVLDFLPHGYASDQGALKSPIAQGLGTTHLSLLELIPKKDVHLQPHQEVYIGEGKRDQIHHIKGKIGPDRLTSTAEKELKHAVEKVVSEINIIPFSEGTEFSIDAGEIEKGKVKVKVFEVSAPYKEIFKGLKTDNEGIDMSQALTIGSMTEPTTNGNWD